MRRRIIEIDESKCDGCGLCAKACHEGAIGMVNGKAKLLRDDYCDGLGDCLPACPTGAITFVEREAMAYDEAAVLRAKQAKAAPCAACDSCPTEAVGSCLQNFPVQLKLVPVNAPYFAGAQLLIAADCTAFACGNFHREFMKGKITLIGCPKLDGVNYAEKLTRIFAENDIRGVTVTRMTVPCCGGLPFAVKNAIAASGKELPLEVVTLTPQGKVAAREVTP